MTEPEWIVTGTGRCGTQYLSELFLSHDIPATHEGLFTYDGIDPHWDARADSSWMAAPHLHRYDCPIIALLRDPAQVAQSLTGISFFTTPGPYLDYLWAYEPDLAAMDPVNAAWQFYVWWNRRVLPFADLVMVIARDSSPYVRSWFTEKSIRGFMDIVGHPPFDDEEVELVASNQWMANARERSTLVAATAGVDPDLLAAAYDIYEPHRAVMS